MATITKANTTQAAGLLLGAAKKLLVDDGLRPVVLRPKGFPLSNGRGEASGKEPFGVGWGLKEVTLATIEKDIRYFAKNGWTPGLGICLGPGRGPGGSWLGDVEGDGPLAEESRTKLFGEDAPPTRGWESARGPHRLWKFDGDRMTKIAAKLKPFQVKAGSQPGVFHLPSLPDLELRLGGYNEDGVVKQLQSAAPPTPATDGTPREWNGVADFADAPESFYQALESIIAELAPKPAVDLDAEIERKWAQTEKTNGEPKPQKNSPTKGTELPLIDRAIRWLAKCDSSVQGQLGSNDLLWAAKVGVFFGLSEEETFRLLTDHYNVPSRCVPVWPEDQVRRKITEARRIAAPGDWRKLADAVREMPSNRNGRSALNGRGSAPPPNRGKGTGQESSDPSEKNRLAPTQGVVEAPDDPHRIGRTFVNEEYFHEEHPRIVRRDDDFYEWRDGCYRTIPEGVATDNLTAAIKSQFDEICLKEMEGYAKAKEEYDKKSEEEKKLSKPPKVPLARKVTGKIHNDTMRALRSMVAIPHDPIPPFWLTSAAGNPDPKQILPTVDGLVDLSSLTISNGSIDLQEIDVYKPTPALFCPYALNYSFDPDFPKPSRWIEFVKQVFPNDPHAQRELQKWFGLLISPDTSYQKILYLIGKTRSGKGTILRVLTHLIGASNITSPALVELAQSFGLSDCIGKSIMLISDARIAGDDGALALLQERLLKISGEDAVQINRKNRDMFTTKLPLRIVIASNSVPSFRDPGGAFRSRMRPLLFLESFEGREDARLFEDKLVPEMPGILNWAIIGKAMLAEDGEFFVPKSAVDLVQSLSESNPTQMFVDECCDTKKDAITTKEDMFIAFQWWCQRTRNHIPPVQVFGKNLFATVPEIQDARAREKADPGKKDRRPPAYRGITLTEEARSASSAWNLQREQGRSRI